MLTFIQMLQSYMEGNWDRALVPLVVSPTEVFEAPDEWTPIEQMKGDVYHEMGRMEEAVRLYPPERDALHGPTHVEQLARIYACVNEQGRALEQIDRLLSIPNIFAPGFFDLEPSYKALRDHPRYEEVVGKD